MTSHFIGGQTFWLVDVCIHHEPDNGRNPKQRRSAKATDRALLGIRSLSMVRGPAPSVAVCPVLSCYRDFLFWYHQNIVEPGWVLDPEPFHVVRMMALPPGSNRPDFGWDGWGGRRELALKAARHLPLFGNDCVCSC